MDSTETVEKTPFSITYDFNDRDQITKEFTIDTEEAGISFPDGIGDFVDKQFETEQEASAYILSQEKDGAIAVSYLVPGEPTGQEEKKIAKAEEAVEAAKERRLKTLGKMIDTFRSRISAFVGCKGCKSKLAHAPLVERFILDGKEPRCPLCDHSLLGGTDQGRLGRMQEKITKAEEAIEVAGTPKPSGELGWVVGGFTTSD